MRRVVFASLAALASCAMPPNVQTGHRVMLDGTRAAFQSCAVSVDFSGAPREMHPNEAARYTAGLGTTAEKWQVDGLVYEQFRMSQTAICACRSVVFSNAHIRATEAALARNPNVKTLPVAGRPFARRVIGIDAPYTAPDLVGDQALLVFPVNAPRCVFIQGGKYLPTAPDALKTFFATLEPIGK
jgi:hypothetical protein